MGDAYSDMMSTIWVSGAHPLAHTVLIICPRPSLCLSQGPVCPSMEEAIIRCPLGSVFAGSGSVFAGDDGRRRCCRRTRTPRLKVTLMYIEATSGAPL